MVCRAVLCWVSIGKEVLRILDLDPGEDLQCHNPVISRLAWLVASSAVTTHHIITRVAINYEGPHPDPVPGLAAAGGGDSAVRGRGGRPAGVPGPQDRGRVCEAWAISNYMNIQNSR